MNASPFRRFPALARTRELLTKDGLYSRLHALQFKDTA